MTGLELVVVVGIAVLVGSMLGPKLHVPTPVPLLLVGVAMAWLPHFGEVDLPPTVVLFLFLPAMLFWEALTSSVRSLRRYVRPILMTSTVLVVITAAAVAWVAHAFGVPWSAALVLGAAVAPTDATVVASMGPLLPQRTMTVLRSESLLNDGTALVVYAVAVELATSSEAHVTALSLTGRFAWSVLGGVLSGLIVALVVMAVRRRMTNTLHDNALQILTPYVAYLLAEVTDASGVLAVVTAGLYLMRTAPLTIGARSRSQSTGFWSVTAFLLNGSLFVLVGLRLPRTVEGLTSLSLGRATLLGVALLLTLFVVRLAFLSVSDGMVRAIRRGQRRSRDTRRAASKARLISAAAGFRGGVSLAMSLSVPTLVSGKAFPARDTILFCTSVVVLGTIVVQGIALPLLVRAAALPEDTTLDTEFHEADQQAADEALDALPELAREHGVDDDAVERIRAELQTHRDAVEARLEGDDEHDAVTAAEGIAGLRSALVGVKREAVVRLRDEGTIDDEVLLALQRGLDREELRWAANQVDPEP